MIHLRLDKYLWAIRLFKTRSQAAKAIEQGAVFLQQAKPKPAHLICIGEKYQVKTESRKWQIEVTDIPVTRLSYQESLKYYSDLTPPEQIKPKQKSAFVEFTGKRQSKQGRPTKKNRRMLAQWDS